jgi:MOSC domain-containing protein YiiM
VSTPRIRTIAIGKERGKPKDGVDRARFRKNHGIDGDCHAGAGDRQVSLIAREDALKLEDQGISAKAGDFAENIVIEGLDLAEVSVGSTLKAGETVLEITERGKPEWKNGDYSFMGVPLVARAGLFARVVKSGWISVGDEVSIEQRS